MNGLLYILESVCTFSVYFYLWIFYKQKQTEILFKGFALWNCVFTCAFLKSMRNDKDSCFFVLHQEEFTSHASKEKDKSLPKSLFMGKFNLNETLFEQGLLDGDFCQVRDKNGKIAYSWTSNEVSTTSGSSNKWMMEGRKELTKKEEEVQRAIFSSWQQGLFKKQKNPKMLEDGPAHLALCDKEQELTEENWRLAQGQLKEAIGAFDKIDKDAKKALQTVGVDNKEDSLYLPLILECNGDTNSKTENV